MPEVVELWSRPGTPPAVRFGDSGGVRILDEYNAAQADALQREAAEFAGTLGEFARVVTGVREAMDAAAARLQRQERRALGARMRVESARDEGAARERRRLREQLAEREQRLERLAEELRSLEAVQREQESMIEALTAG